MQIQAGDLAPTFHVEDVFGDSISLDEYAGKRLLLSFYRNSACAICNLRVHQLIQRYPAYRHGGLELLAVFESPRQNILENVGRQDVPFPIIADPPAQLYALYDVEVSEDKVAKTMSMPETQATIRAAAERGFVLTREEGSNFNRMPAEFLIGPGLTVEIAHYADYVMDHLPFEVIERFLSA
ncbi:MAG TPA: redoxin domain-containing protein [Roseiflexaceae bacterium]|nr:redoxin domain-containing protein [Roseiflexaceae bacterium]